MLQIRWHGHSCFEITDENVLVTDPHDGKSIGISAPQAQADVVLVSHDHYDHNSIKTVQKEGTKIVREPGKKTAFGTPIKGYPSFHDKEEGKKRGENIIYKFQIEGISFCHLGDLGHILSDEIAEKINGVDVLFIPVGENFTVDVDEAWSVIEKIQPRIVIPMHYKVGGLSLPISSVEPFLEKKNDDYKILRVGNEIDIEKEDLPTDSEIWVFTL